MATTIHFHLPALLCAALAAPAPLLAQQPDRVSLHFATASAELSDDAYDALNALCERIGERPPRDLTITGFTDERGSDAYNLRLSQLRADAVRTALLDVCPELDATNVQWKGERTSTEKGNDVEALAYDRRVDITWSNEHADEEQRSGPRSLYDALIPGAAQPFERTTVDASRPIAWTTSEGVQVRMDANALLDGNGEAVSGDVDLYYRSFNDPWQTVASGIPMHFRTPDGDVLHMESAFMVEVLAEKNGKPLQLKEGSNVSYDIPQQSPTAPDFSTFVIDPSTKDWVNGGAMSSPNDSVTGASAFSVAADRYMRKYADAMSRVNTDTATVDERVASKRYAGLVTCEPSAKPYRSHNGHIYSPYPSNAPAVRIALLPGRETYHGHIGFRIVLENGAARTAEWSQFPRGMGWAYTGDLARKAFTRSFVRRHYYSDVRLVHDPGTGSAIIRLKDRGQWIEIPVSAELADASLKSSGGFDACLQRYNTALSKRLGRADKRYAVREAYYQSSDRSARKRAYATAKPIMLPTESDMPAEQFHVLALAQHQRSFAPMSMSKAGSATLTTLTSSGLGLCNIDRLIKYSKVEQVIVRFENTDGKAFPWVNAFVINEGRNAVVTLWGNGKDVQPLEFAPGRMDWLVLASQDGEVALVKGSELKNTDDLQKLHYTSLPKDMTMADLRMARRAQR